MGKPRFKPAQICTNPRQYGRIAQPTWAEPNPLNQTETAWAIFQHRAAWTVLQELKASGRSIADLATITGDDPKWLERKLHGQAPADLGDILSWTLTIGVDVLPIINDRNELRTTPITRHQKDGNTLE